MYLQSSNGNMHSAPSTRVREAAAQALVVVDVVVKGSCLQVSP